MSTVPASGSPRAASSAQTGALAVHTGTTIAVLAASSALVPLYRLYQAAWHFSPVMLTLIFASYVLALLATLMIAGSLSDHIGRRPALTLALGLNIVAMGVFLVAGSPTVLLVARLVQGVATGIATATLAATLLDLHQERGALINSVAPMTGMAVGALGSAVLVDTTPFGSVFVLLLVVFCLNLGLTWRMPETVRRRPGALRSLRPRLVIPPGARAELLAITPINVSIWALGGFYLSLMPSLIAAVTGTQTALLAGGNVAALTLSGAAAILVIRRHGPMVALTAGGMALIVGLCVTLTGANQGIASLLIVGSVIAGVGFGAGFSGAMRRLAPLAAPHERAGLMAAFYVESYLANSLPTILAGVLIPRLGLLAVTNLYGGALIGLVGVGLLLTRMRHRRALA
ncbi:MFS transporter [Roseospira marina]|nr:MFS transporter [Roseospira marina]MBB4315268.1 MFS family permease [Roseospira marina]MBB5088268.1 MFS family permease [Roseospira marina]